MPVEKSPSESLAVKRGRIRGIGKVACVTILILFIPALRSCGEVSSGFPFVAVNTGSDPGLTFHWPNLALNAIIAGIAILAAFLALKRVRSPAIKKALSSGLDFIGIYALLVHLGYYAVYPLLSNADELSVGGRIFLGYALFIHPYIEIVHDTADSFPSAIGDSPLYGDGYDFPMRVGFALMCALWFILGFLKGIIATARTKKRGPAAIGPTAPPGKMMET